MRSPTVRSAWRSKVGGSSVRSRSSAGPADRPTCRRTPASSWRSCGRICGASPATSRTPGARSRDSRTRTAPPGSKRPLWRAPLYLYYTAPPLEDPGIGFPPSFSFVGPGLWEPPAPAPSWLDELPEPLVIVSVSSEFQHDHALIETALRALADEPVGVAVSTAAHDPESFAAPANARLARWLPHGALLSRAACVVCHGGMGITQKTLAAGVPLCIVPFGRDQFEVGARVVALGAGTCLPPDQLSADALRAAVREAMTMRRGAEQVADAFARSGGAAAAASALEAQLTPLAATNAKSASAPAGSGGGR
jgi:MGT family glycosyltransferase